MKRFFLFITLLLIFHTELNAQITPPTIQACGSSQQFCLSETTFELCVKIEVVAGLPADIDHFEITWGDNSPITNVPGSSNPANQFHIYDFTSFFSTCEFEEERLVKLETFLVDGTVYNSLFLATFRNPPTAILNISPSIICVGDEICFDNNSCPTEQLTTVSYNYGDGSSLGTDECHIYNQVGTYNVTLEVMNPCGSDIVTQQVQVINPAEADITITSNNIDTTAIPFIYCLGSGLVDLDGDSLSLNENFYEWQSLNNISGASWVLPPDYPNQNDATPNTPDLSVSFSETGLYLLILEVNNECDQPDFDTISIQVLSGVALTQPEQMDACLELIYTPDPYNPNASYTINGVIQSTFPVTLAVGDYEVICTLMNECGTQTTIDNFTVFDQEDVTILSPFPDTTLCVGSDSIMIFYEPFGGTWEGDHLLIYGDSVFFNPTDTGSFEITYEKGIGACKDMESIIIHVIGVVVLVDDVDVCSSSDPFILSASPPGGIFSSTDCPSCIDVDTFIISEMILNGLSSVDVNYITNVGNCDGNNTFTVTLDDPNAMFVIDETFCIGDAIPIDIINTNGDLEWMIDGVNVGAPPFSSTTLGAGTHIIKLTTTAGDCDTMKTDTITIFSVPTDVSFTIDVLEGCADLEVTLTNTTTPFDNEAYEWYLGDSLISTAIQPESFILESGFSDTTYTFTLNASNSCEGAEATQDVIVFPRPVPLFGPMKNNYCSGDTVTLANVSFGGPMSSWFWDYGNGTTSTDSIPLQIIYFTGDVPTVYTISLTATNDCGTETFNYDLTVHPTDVEAFFNIDPVEGCVGVPVCLTNLSTIGSSLLWDFGDGNTSTQANPCHTYSTAGNYIIKLKAFGCGFDSIQFEVVIHPMPSAIFSNNTITCPGDAMSFTNNSLLAQNFFWDFGDGMTSTLNNPDHTYTASGIYQVKLLATSTEGCVDSSFSTITVLIPPTAIFTISTDSVCVGDNITFTNTSTPSPLTCFWNFGDGNFSNDCVANHSYDTSGNFMVTLVVMDGDGCRDTTQQLVNIAANPVAAFDFVKNGECTPVEVIFQNQSLMGESYIWDFGDGTTSTETAPTHIYMSGDTFTISLTTFSGVCSDMTNREVIIFKKPEIEIVIPLGYTQSGCADFTTAFTVSPEMNNFKFSWDFGDGNFSYEENPENTFNTPGTYNVQVIVEDTLQNNCADTASILVTVYVPVDGTITTVDNSCFGDSLGSIEIVVDNGTPEYQYDWSNGGDSTIISNLPAGDYTFTVTDSNGCDWTEMVTIYEPAAPLSLAILQQEIVTCYGGDDGSIFITANGGTEDYDYLWENGSTNSSLENVSAGNYNITITDANNCVLEEIVTVQQNDSISYNANITNISCHGSGDGQVSLDSLSGGVAPYFITMDTLTGTAFTGLEMGNYLLTIMDAEGCMQNFGTMIFEPSPVEIMLDTNFASILLGEMVEIKSDYNIVNPTFSWTPTRWLDCADCPEPIAQPHDDITYIVTMINENGCTDTDSIFITVFDERKIAIPDAFTPNNDGENDLFTLRGINPGVLEVEYFRIYDRWGGMLYEAKNFQLNDFDYGWDGKVREKDVTVGVYLYKAKVNYIDNVSILHTGQVTILR